MYVSGITSEFLGKFTTICGSKPTSPIGKIPSSNNKPYLTFFPVGHNLEPNPFYVG